MPGNDTCLITSTTPQNITTDAGTGTDTLQLGGASAFSLDVSKIGPSQVFQNFEIFQKIDSSDVTLTGTATTGVDWDIQGGMLTASGGDAIGNANNINVGSAGTFALANGETIGSLSGNGALALGANALTAGNGVNSTWTGSSTGTGGITKVGSSTFTIGSGQGYTGLTDVTVGELKLNGSLAGALTVKAGAKVSGTGTVAGTVTNNGDIAPGSSPGVQTYLGNYVAGAGATFTMDVQLNNGGTPSNGTTHDFVNIMGNVTGTTAINLVPTGTPVPTSGNGFELVQIGGTVSPTEFQLSAPLFSGGFQYALNYLPNFSGSFDGFFLQSHVREEIYGQAAILASGQAMTQACFRGDDRMPDTPNDPNKARGWAKFTQGSLKTGTDTGIDTNQDYTCGSGGVDFPVGSHFRLGTVGGYGLSKADIATPSGGANLTGDDVSVEAVATYVGEHSFANLSAGYSQADWSFKGPVLGSNSATSSGLIGSLKAGMGWPMGRSLGLKLIGEVDYDGTGCDSSCLLAGTTEDLSQWLAKGSVRLDASFSDGKILPYVALSYLGAFDGGNSVTLGSALIGTKTASSLLGLSGGVTASVSGNATIFANIDYTDSLERDVHGLGGSVGATIHW